MSKNLTNKPHTHTLDSINEVLQSRGLSSFLKVLAFKDSDTLQVQDAVYGPYNVSLKSVCPSVDFPLHKNRRHQNKLASERTKYVGSSIGDLTITDVFYGPDRGYKNRSFYFEYRGLCGHTCIGTKVYMSRHKRTATCMSCCNVTHGERTKIEGIRKKRTPTYIAWIGIHKTLPEKYRDFSEFKRLVGEKPSKKASIIVVDGDATWVDLEVSEDADTQLMAQALRQVFRHSSFYKEALRLASVETENGTRFRCASCGELFLRSKIQVDHIEPIVRVAGPPLTRENLLDRIWTREIQILDKKCHIKKSMKENADRKKATLLKK